MCVEIIDHQANHLSLEEMHIDQLLHLLGKVTRCASGGDVDLAQPRSGCTKRNEFAVPSRRYS